MPAVTSSTAFLEVVAKSGVVDKPALGPYQDRADDDPPERLAQRLVTDGLLTPFQAKQFLQGKYKRFQLCNKYRILEPLGAGGMGSVYLCEHVLMKRLVAVKVLPQDKSDTPGAVERFYREARAVAALNHPNIVRAYDVDRDGEMPCLIMEYVDGSNLHDLVVKNGPLPPARAAHYVAQAALGLQHAHLAGWVHRDIKPGNLLLDRSGIIKILDMGLARMNFHDDGVTKKFDGDNILGTADYLSPEQAINKGPADIRSDIYSLGATLYFLLTGEGPFEQGSIAQKLLWHQIKEPDPVTRFRSDVPPGLVAVLTRMMAKNPAARYQVPETVAEALAPWMADEVPVPTDAELPEHCPAVKKRSVVKPDTALASGVVQALRGTTPTPPPGPPPTAPAKTAAPETEVLPLPLSALVDEEAPAKARPRPAWLLYGGLWAGAVAAATVAGFVLTWSGAFSTKSARKDAGTAAARPTTPTVALPAPGPAGTPAEAVTYRKIRAEEAGQHLNESCEVQFLVKAVGQSKGERLVFLNSDENWQTNPQALTVVLAPTQAESLGKAWPEGWKAFKGKTIRVRGKVTKYEKTGQVEIKDPHQVEVVED